MEICFLERLRDEIKFPSVDALREQIARDVKKARRYFHLLRRASGTGVTPRYLVRQIAKLHGEFAVDVHDVHAVVDGVDLDQSHRARLGLHLL